MNRGGRSILNEDGSCADEFRDVIPDNDLLAILRTILLNRVVDRRLMMLQRQGRLGFYLTSTGEEVVTVGTAYALQEDDPIFLTYRELGALLWRKVPLSAIMNQLIGNVQDINKGRQMPVHYCYREYHIPSISSPVGTQLPHACGFGYAAKMLKTNQVALAFLGEGTASQTDFHAALNFSGVLNAQTIFVIRNNGYAISTPESVQTRAPSLAIRAEGYGIPGFQIDGNDLLMVVQTVKEAAARARSGGGPTLIEALTYRMGAHSSSDDPTRYRSEEETQRWEKVDALARLRLHAKWRGIWTDAMEEEVWADAEKAVTQMISDCERWPPPPVESLFDDVYERMPESLRMQKEEYLRFLREKSRQ
ncbi:MAG: thiamine pyrophosphate-dependent enzyme [Candidatus Poribacteria bacterium]|nr:thiamine pyrophosphate-dependent enzyme [Candidatus Poribacteria bacterium]